MSIVNGSLQIAGGNNAWHTTYAAEIPLARQIVINTQTGQYKIGDGSTALSGLTYYGGQGSGGTWGSITGTLSNQTDLQNALNAKLNTSSIGVTVQGYSANTTLLGNSTTGSGSIVLASAISSFITASSTDTLTNKRITARAGTVASSATPTINTNNIDYFSITALATAITSFTTNLSGTPTTGQTLWVSITDNGTARAITWGASFESSGNITLPTTTVVSTRLDVAFIWNEATNKWRCVGVA